MTGVNDRERSAALPHGIQGAADSSFACTARAFSQLFPGRRFGGGALSVYLHGEPVVDIWTGYADRRGTEYWSADTGAMVFSVTKGLASTVIHRLSDRGLIGYFGFARNGLRMQPMAGKDTPSVTDVSTVMQTAPGMWAASYSPRAPS